MILQLKGIIKIILNRFGIESSRTLNIFYHLFWSILYKLGGIIASFLMVSIALECLDSSTYGVWLTMSSFIGWFSLFDIGLGNGLRNKFAFAKSGGDIKTLQSYVSTSYFALACICLLLILLFLGFNSFVDWSVFFNSDVRLKEQLSVLVPLIFILFVLQMLLKLIVVIYLADEKHSIENKVNFFIQFISLGALFGLNALNLSSLFSFGILISIVPVIVLFSTNFYSFRTVYAAIVPRWKHFDKAVLKDTFNLSFSFFIVQIAATVLFATDSYIIAKMMGPEYVVAYTAAFKYFSIVTIAYTTLLAPYWSAFSMAYFKGDFHWIRDNVKKIQRFWFLIPLILGVMIMLADKFYSVWLGDKVIVPFSLTLSMSLFVAMLTFNMIYVNFINGVGKVRLQMITSVITIFLNIPLCIFFVGYLKWGLAGVVLASCFSLGYSILLRPMQYKRIINNSAHGIWGR
jgi:O-antigen/teichoic acid export membrane protein